MEKKITVSLLAFASILLVSCKSDEPKKDDFNPDYEANEKRNPVEFGKELFENKGNCYACHKPDQKIVGPSIAEIAKIYKDKNGSIVTFLKGEGEPIVDPSQYEVMKTNFAITKNMSDDELKAIEAYIYSNLK